MTKYRPADFADDETSSMGSIQIGENSNNSPGVHVRFENPGTNHNLHNHSSTLAYLQHMVRRMTDNQLHYNPSFITTTTTCSPSPSPFPELAKVVALQEQL